MQKRIISLLLLAALIFSLAACNTDSGNAGNNTTDTVASSINDLPAGIEKKDYDKASVNIVYPKVKPQVGVLAKGIVCLLR